MSWYDLGNPPITSTQGLIAAPSTSDLIAELDSTELGTKNFAAGQQHNARVTWVAGASTTAIFRLEVAASTALANPTSRMLVWTPTGQSGQYVTNVRLSKDSRLRVLMESTGANAAATIQAEFLT